MARYFFNRLSTSIILLLPEHYCNSFQEILLCNIDHPFHNGSINYRIKSI